jgi:hypothetical protein
MSSTKHYSGNQSSRRSAKVVSENIKCSELVLGTLDADALVSFYADDFIIEEATSGERITSM